MSRSLLAKIALMLVIGAAFIAACGGGRVRLTSIAPQPTQPPALLATPAPQGPAASQDPGQALEELDGSLGSADTLPDLTETPGADVDQALDQLDKSLSTTDTMKDLPN